MSDTGLMTGPAVSIRSGGADETFNVGALFGREAPDDGLLGLVGPLGAGKTLFVKGLAAGLGIESASIHSPTYTLCHFHEGRRFLCHIDLYRLNDPAEIEEVGLEDILDRQGIIAVEWAERGQGHLPAGRVSVQLVCMEGDQRTIILKGSDGSHAAWIKRVIGRLPDSSVIGTSGEDG
ncbi:MAG: tRNA (adenosine(37)-N6)-threonylcarbamoyltransferase complex ATPase subunit type 1 TsaE [Nitrospiria bacterium]